MDKVETRHKGKTYIAQKVITTPDGMPVLLYAFVCAKNSIEAQYFCDFTGLGFEIALSIPSNSGITYGLNYN